MVQHPQQRLRRAETILNSIDHLILLDLLGAAEPSIQSYFLSTAWMFDGLIDIEKRLNGANLAPTQDSFFIPRTGLEHNDHGIGDDHIPFLNRGVSILHLIANPFPRVWHRLQVGHFRFDT
jgi:glutaminyl-peptide cyclotransferase